MDPKTAKQHNAPPMSGQSGQESQAGRTVPLRPWTLRDLKDTRQNVREAVAAAAFVPAGAKAMLVEMIDQTFPQARLLSLDAHLHVFSRGNKQTADFCLTISEL